MGEKLTNPEISDSEKKKEDWMNSKWRPAMGWLYMLVCFCDFALFPVLHAIYVAALFKNGVASNGVPAQWAPLTLQGAGLFHLAMGAVLGLAAYGRTQEKLSGANNGGLTLPGNIGASYQQPAVQAPASFAPAPAQSFSPAQSFNSTISPTFVSKQGKPGPIIEEPEL
jgi:hypothetical protein